MLDYGKHNILGINAAVPGKRPIINFRRV